MRCEGKEHVGGTSTGEDWKCEGKGLMAGEVVCTSRNNPEGSETFDHMAG